MALQSGRYRIGGATLQSVLTLMDGSSESGTPVVSLPQEGDPKNYTVSGKIFTMVDAHDKS